MGNKISQRGMQHYPQHSTSDDDYHNQILDNGFCSLKHLILTKTDNLELVAEKPDEISVIEGESDK